MTMMTLDSATELIKHASLHTRRGVGRIVPASRYLANLEKCVGGMCPALPADWQELVKASATQLTYRNSDTVVVNSIKRVGAKIGGSLPGSILDFDCVITSTRKDRDGDILESLGAHIDPKCPLLWQHVPAQPIGVMRSVLEQTKTRMCGAFSIADTELGRDAATLVEMGALRISHGFDALEYEPLDKKDDSGWRVNKFDIVEVSLVSVPSNIDAVITAFSRDKLHAPLVKAWASNAYQQRQKSFSSGTVDTDCGCGKHRAAAQKDLFGETLVAQQPQPPINITVNIGGKEMTVTPTVDAKAAEAVVDTAAHDVSVIAAGSPGTTDDTGDDSGVVVVDTKAATDSDAIVTADVTDASINDADDATLDLETDKEFDPKFSEDDAVTKSLTKMIGMVSTKEYYGPLEGSYEERISDLNERLKPFLAQSAFRLPAESYCYILGTFPDSVIFSLQWQTPMDSVRELYRLAYEMAEGGEPEFKGFPVKVEINVSTSVSDATNGMKEVDGAAMLIKAADDYREKKLAGEKAGRSLSSRNMTRIKEAHSCCTEVVGMNDVSRAAKSLCKEACGHMKEAMDEAEQVTDIEKEKSSHGDNAAASQDATGNGASAGNDARPRSLREAAAIMLSMIDAGNASEAAELGRSVVSVATLQTSQAIEDMDENKIAEMVGNRLAGAFA